MAPHESDRRAVTKAFAEHGPRIAALITEGRKRGLSFNQMAKLTSFNAAQRFGQREEARAPGHGALELHRRLDVEHHDVAVLGTELE